MNRESTTRLLRKVYRQALFLAFITLFGLMAIYIVGYLQASTSQAESLIEPAARLVVLLCVVAVFCRLGADMIEAWKRGKE